MAVPIITDWEKYFSNPHEGLGSSYERIILNNLLYKVVDNYNINNALETPSFGFTGISGINLLSLAKKGVKITLEDHNLERLDLIKGLWAELNMELTAKLNGSYQVLDYPDKAFDLGYNFSALWFVKDLRQFLSELCRACSKAILLCVPNRNGIGYKMQIKDYSANKYPTLKPESLDPLTLKYLMQKQGWKLKAENYIDCPPWPDIGMTKELFLGKILGRSKQNCCSSEAKASDDTVSILPYYQDADPDFADRMMRYSFVEQVAPNFFKKYWAHHYYLLFTPKGS